jgi:hypothetical protein
MAFCRITDCQKTSILDIIFRTIKVYIFLQYAPKPQF